MKLAYKASGVMALLGFGTLLIVLLVFAAQSERQAINNGLDNLSSLSKQVSNNINTRLVEKATISLAFSSSPNILNALQKSNRDLQQLTEDERNKKIASLEQQWKAVTGIDDPFVQQYTSNSTANYLKLQQTNTPDLYGEIFLTNQFGVMIASTGKLTTLSHAHKYWWKKAYNQGQGKIFFDDRGFDESVAGYVVGIVIPIKKNNKIVGILKSNINVMGLLKHVIDTYAQTHQGDLKVVRSGGLIVAAQGLLPLVERLPSYTMEYLLRDKSMVLQHDDSAKKLIHAFSPIAITMGSDDYGFGGVASSTDHRFGNVGEGWHVVISSSETEVLAAAKETQGLVIWFGIIFTILITVSALLFGRMISRPLVSLTERAKNIGRGEFDTQASIDSSDEIGSLSRSFNKMAVDLNTTMISRDALREESEVGKEMNKLLLDSVADGIFGTDMNCNVTFINPAAYTMLGFTADEIVNQPICTLISKDQDDSDFCRRVGCAIENRNVYSEYQHNSGKTLWRKDGSSFISEYTTTPVRRNDELIGTVVTFRDITEKTKALDEATLLQRQVQQSQKMEAIGKLTGGVAHDFNNMLSAILGYSNLSLDALEEGVDTVRLRKYITEVVKAGERSRDLVIQMLAFSRGEMGEMKRVELGRVSNDIIQMLRVTIPSSIEVSYKKPDNELYVNTDVVQLNQVIMNLVINARDAIEDETGSIVISINDNVVVNEYCSSCHANYSGNYVSISISDTGIGMSDEIAQQIFTPFYTTKEVGKGTGMGLAMVHGIMHGCGGHIRLISQPNKGTTISLLFPKIDVHIDEDKTLEDSFSNFDKDAQGHILVVDDEDVLVTLLKEQLTVLGYKVTAFTDPLEAFDWFKKSKDEIDLIITDQTMPGMSGDELVIRALEIRKDIPIILTTGFSEIINEAKAYEIGVRQFLAKPVNYKTLLQVINDILNP